MSKGHLQNSLELHILKCKGLRMVEIDVASCCIFGKKSLLPTIADAANVWEDAASIYQTRQDLSRISKHKQDISMIGRSPNS